MQQALCGDLEQLPTAAAYSLLFAEWAEGCMGHISLGEVDKLLPAVPILGFKLLANFLQPTVRAMDGHNVSDPIVRG